MRKRNDWPGDNEKGQINNFIDNNYARKDKKNNNNDEPSSNNYFSFSEYYENKGPGPLTESMKNNI